MRTLLYTLLAVFCFASSLFAVEYGSVSIIQISASSIGQDSSHGYMEYRFRVTNRDKKAHHVALSLPHSSFGGDTVSLDRLSKSVEVPPESSVVLTLLQPPVKVNGGNDARVTIDGRQQREPIASMPNTHMSVYKGNAIAIVLTSQGIPSSVPNVIVAESGGGEGAQGGTEVTEGEITPTTLPRASMAGSGIDPPSVNMERAVLPVSDWSVHWLAYSRYDGVAVTSAEWKELQEQRPAIFQALRQYTEAGGVLLIYGTDWNPPQEWISDGDRYRAGLGCAFVMNKGGSKAEEQSQINLFHPLVLAPSMRWDSAFGQNYSGSRYYGRYGNSAPQALLSSETPLLTTMPVVKEYGVSVRLVLALIIVFAVLIGPVNIYALSKMKRRIWLLWTVPALSLVASVLVFGISFLKEGFLRQTSSITYTVLDQRRETAVSFGFVGYYATLTPRALLFSPHTEATPCVNRSYRSARRSLEADILPDGTQRFSGNWIAARVPSYFMLRKSEPMRKERILFDWSSAQPTATNGLGVALDTLAVCAADGKIYEAKNIQPGEKITLNDTGTKATNSPSGTLLHAQMNYNGIFNGTIPSTATRTLSPNTYLATANAWNPFIEPGIDRMKPYSNQTIICGFFE